MSTPSWRGRAPTPVKGRLNMVFVTDEFVNTASTSPFGLSDLNRTLEITQ
jgi:hypothetical protein